ncbi:MAG TPA: SDR family NAD(P)-dependent oxidoreductase [Rhizomicrobium sp.]|nr:SDR family NAD(P)-dependent oxidoreductase [Rhizomicrobium sp.]
MSDHIEASRRSAGIHTDTVNAEPVRRAPSAASQKQNGPGFFAGRFSGRTAVITGGASGLGLLTAERIVNEGGKVSLWDLNEAALAGVAQRLGNAHTHKVHVGRHPDVADAVKKSLEALGKIDILVNCAGITGATVPVQDFPVDNWLQVMDVNLNGIFFCCREIVPAMLAQGYGRIVNIASVAGKEGNPKASAYSASKAGVIGFTKSLGKELATSGVLVNCITPATFESPILDQLPQSQIDYMRSRIPMGRLGHAEECAALVCWLASEECSFSTAATFDISGGRTTY